MASTVIDEESGKNQYAYCNNPDKMVGKTKQLHGQTRACVASDAGIGLVEHDRIKPFLHRHITHRTPHTTRHTPHTTHHTPHTTHHIPHTTHHIPHTTHHTPHTTYHIPHPTHHIPHTTYQTMDTTWQAYNCWGSINTYGFACSDWAKHAGGG